MNLEHAPILYTRPDCHLCRLAENMLLEIGVRWQAVDIESDPELELNYGIRIPVLFLPESGRELAFPFDADSLKGFLESDNRP